MTIPNPLVARLLLRLFPFRAEAKFAQHSPEELRRRYFKWHVFCTAAFLVLAVAVSYGLHDLLVTYTQSGPRTPAVHELRPDGLFWWVPAATLGCVLAGLLVRVLYRVLLRERSEEFRYYANLRTGLNATRMYFAIGIVFGLASLALAYFAAQSSLRMTADELVIRRIWSLTDEHYPYTRIRGLREIHERRKDRTIFVIELTDADDWTTQVEVIFPGEEEKAYLARRSGRPIERVEAE